MNTGQLYKIFTEHPAVTTDSRCITPGSIFFALKGGNFNGNSFAGSALEQGASFAIVDEKEYQKDNRYILVEDALKALQELAAFHRKQFPVPVIAITGTNGKTTTKELIQAVLSRKYKTIATEGNLNNHIGVPLTLLKINKETEIAIVEMGANHEGEIAMLCSLADPGYGLITNIGKAHLEGFNGFEGVIRAKTELYHYIKEHKGKIFINSDNPLLKKHAEGINQISYGMQDSTGIHGTIAGNTPFVAMELTAGDVNIRIESQLFGEYNAYNILAAACVGSEFKIDPDDIKAAIEGYIPKNNRSQVKKSGSNILVLDAYNANPDSMRLAIENFLASPMEKKILILGDMLELGTESDTEHQSILNLLNSHNITHVYLVGPVFTRLNTKREWHCFQDSELARLWFEHHKFEGASILVKGSRGIKLERVIEVL